MTNIIRLTTIHSTNDFLIQKTAMESLPELTFVITDEQTNGRGFLDNLWESEPKTNITTSGLFYPTFISASNLYVFNMCISLAVTDTIERFISSANKVSIKWPNDIYVDSNKIAGILIEAFFSDNKLDYIVAGIGLNVNQTKFISNAPNPVSIKQVTGKTIDLDVCFDTLLTAINERYAQLKGLAFESIAASYHAKLYKRGQLASFISQGIEFKGVIKHVRADGKLVIEDQEKKELFFSFKDIEFIL